MANETPRLPEGAGGWVPPTDAEIKATSKVTLPDIADAKAAAAEHGGLLDDLLNAESYNG